jgi:hypothetical protein
MVNYQLGKIYKIVGNGLTYYGSTCEPTLARRLAGHVAQYKHYKKGIGVYMRSFDIIETGEYTIVLAEGFVCDTKDQLHARERYYIENNECTNKVIPGRSNIEWRCINQERLKECDGKRYLNNRESIIKKVKMYRDTHSEMIQEKRSRKFNCKCGGKYTQSNKSVHSKTEKHLAYITQESVMSDNTLLL